MAATNKREHLRAKLAACLASVDGIGFAERSPSGRGSEVTATNVTYTANGAFRVGGESYESLTEGKGRTETGECLALAQIDVTVKTGASIDAAVDDVVQRTETAIKNFSGYGPHYSDDDCTVAVRSIDRAQVAPAIGPDATTASVALILTITYTVTWKR